MLIYVVTEELHSHRTVVAVFSDASLAQRVAAHVHEGRILPMTLDADAERLSQGWLPYAVWGYSTGEVDIRALYPPLDDTDAMDPTTQYVWARSPAEARALAPRQEP